MIPKRKSYHILCAACRKRVYLYKGDFTTRVLLSQFVPFEGVPAPAPGEPMMCPFCKKPWYMVNARTGGVLVLTDQGIRPHEPTQSLPQSGGGFPIAAPETPPEFRGNAPDFTEAQTPKKEKQSGK